MLVGGKRYRSVWFEENRIKMINQILIPSKFEIVDLMELDEVAEAIKTMVVRGAPAIGATGAYGMALAVMQAEDPEKSAEVLRKTRPTANDLFRAIDYVLDAVKNAPEEKIAETALEAAEKYADWSVKACKSIGEHGSVIIKDGSRIATHCNAGWLACVDWGTALAPMYAAKRQGKKLEVYVDETRPRLQGARITAWELLNEKIPHAVIADNALGHYMQRGEVDMMIVGADRVAGNGDIANKIGTYEKAVVAGENNVPFYVAAPSTTIDTACKTGKDIPIEERGEEEMHFIGKERLTPEGSSAKNPAFDVTPAKFIKGIITERGIFRPGEISNAFSR